MDGEQAGLTAYQPEDDAIAFTHTRIFDQFEGRGLGSVLISTALDDARDSGHHVLPYCPFVQAYILRHPEYLDLVPAGRRSEFELPEAG